MDTDNLLFLVDNLWRAAALGFVVGVVLWLFRRLPVVRKVRASAIFAVVGWSAYWIVSGLDSVGLDGLLDLLLSAAILLSANIGVQVFDVFVWQILTKRRGKRLLPRLLLEIFNVALMIAAALLVLNGIYGVDLSAFLVTSTVISAVIGLALQDMLGNVVSGLALQFDGSVEVDDWILVDGQEGRVIGMNWRTVTIVNIDNHAITIPNSMMATNDLTNYSKPALNQRLHVKVGLPYGVPPGVIKRLLLPATLGAEGVLREPLPDILTSEYGDSAIIYDVRFWVDDYSRRLLIQDEVLSRIWYAIRRHGVSVPFPIRDVNLRTITDEDAKREAERQMNIIFDLLRPLPILAPMSDEQVWSLARESDYQLYYAGELLVRQGDPGETLFVVKSGTARVEFINEKGVRKIISEVPANEFFGEMSLLTGDRRRASVIAATDMRVVIVGKQALADVVKNDLLCLEALTEIMEKRLKEISELAEAEATFGGGPESENLFASISKFLGVGNKEV